MLCNEMLVVIIYLGSWIVWLTLLWTHSCYQWKQDKKNKIEFKKFEEFDQNSNSRVNPTTKITPQNLMSRINIQENGSSSRLQSGENRLGRKSAIETELEKKEKKSQPKTEKFKPFSKIQA